MAGNIFSLIFLFTLFSSNCLKETLVDGAVDAPPSACFASIKDFRGMQIVHRYGPCSTLDPKISSRQILMKDQARVRSINSLISNKYATNDLGEGASLPLSHRDIGGGNYVVKAGFGSPKRDFNLIVDTGSELTWLHCTPKGYQPSASSTFSNASCSVGRPCDFKVTYSDKSSSTGYLIRDTLTITPSDVILNFEFGCGMHISSDSDFGTADGLLALGNANKYSSLLSQTSTKFSKIFCYCLPRSDTSTGYLLFGSQALQTCKTKTSTPLISDPDNPTLYYVNLGGISIGNKKIVVSPKAILDSGTVITRLPTKAYSILRSEFVKFMSKYEYPRVKTTDGDVLDTCYNLTGYGNVTKPKLVLHFANFRVNLDPSAALFQSNGTSKVCLAFAGDHEMTIIGNHQQRTLNVLYDNQGKKIGFGTGRGSCVN